MNGFYSTPVSISELGSSDHCMVLRKPDRGSPDIHGNVTRVTVKCMGPSEKAAFAMGVASIRWEPLFHVRKSIKFVTRHTADKPWITDLFRNLMRKARRTYSRLHLFTTRLNCREPIGSRPCSVHCPDYTTTRSTPSDSLNAAGVYAHAPWCHLVMTAVVIG